MLAEIEQGQTRPSADLLADLAAELACDIDDLQT